MRSYFLLSYLKNIMTLRIIVLIIVFLRISMSVHHDLGEVQKFLPESDSGCSAGRYRILLWHFSGPFVDVVKICLDELALPLIMYPNIGLIIDLPAPPVIVHRPQRHVLPIEQVNFRMQHSLSRLINWHIVPNQSLEKHVVENALENRLVPATCRQNCCWDSALDRIDELSIEFEHRVMVGLDDSDLFLSVSHLV